MADLVVAHPIFVPGHPIIIHRKALEPSRLWSLDICLTVMFFMLAIMIASHG